MLRTPASNSSGVRVASRSSDAADRATVTTARDRAGSMCIRNHSQEGIARSCSAVGCTHSRWSRPGPGARSPYRWTSIRKPANASWPVTFCSMIAGTRDSMTRPLRPRRACGWWRWISASTGCLGSKPSQLSRPPSRSGACSSAHSAPGPQASRWTSPAAGRPSTASVAGPSGVRVPRQCRPCASTRWVGSPPPWRCWFSREPTGHGQAGRQTRVRPGVLTPSA